MRNKGESMGRGQKIDHQELRASILAAATEIISAQGTSALSTRKIARKIGCAVGTIYNIFSNIDEVILTINVATMTKLQAQLLAETRQDDDPLTSVIRLGESYVSFSQDHYHLWSLLIAHKPSPDTPLPEWFQKKIDDLFVLVSQRVMPLVDNDRARAEGAARVLWASLHGICSLAISGKLDTVHAEKAEVLAESLIRNYLQGLQLNQ